MPGGDVELFCRARGRFEIAQRYDRMVFEGIDAVEGAMAEILFSQPIPEVLQRIEFREMRGQDRPPLRDANCVVQGYAAQAARLRNAAGTTTAESACASVPTPARTPPRCRPAAPAHGAPRPAAIGP